MGDEQRRSPGCARAAAIVVALGLVAVVSIVGWCGYQISEAGRRLPGAQDQLEVVRSEPITGFVPDGAVLTDSHEVLATKDLLGSDESDSGVVRRFDTDDVAATMLAFLAPALGDGWRLVDVACRRTLNTSEMVYVKEVSDPDGEGAGETATLTLRVAYEPFGGGVEVAVTNPRQGSAELLPIEPVFDLLLTGVARTDPGCLRSRREGPPTSGAAAPTAVVAPWTSAQTCAVIAAAWPGVSVEPSSSEYCVVTGGASPFNVKAIGTVDPYEYEDDRLSSAGGPTRFATTDGGFWVARPDGIALYGVARSAALAEEDLLGLAERLAVAPAPS